MSSLDASIRPSARVFPSHRPHTAVHPGPAKKSSGPDAEPESCVGHRCSGRGPLPVALVLRENIPAQCSQDDQSSTCRTRRCVRLKSPDPIVRDSSWCGVQVGLTATPIRSPPRPNSSQREEAGANPTGAERRRANTRRPDLPAAPVRPALVSSFVLGQARPGAQYYAHRVAEHRPRQRQRRTKQKNSHGATNVRS